MKKLILMQVEEADMRRVAFLPHMLKMQWLIFKAIPPTRPASPNGLLVHFLPNKTC